MNHHGGKLNSFCKQDSIPWKIHKIPQNPMISDCYPLNNDFLPEFKPTSSSFPSGIFWNPVVELIVPPCLLMNIHFPLKNDHSRRQSRVLIKSNPSLWHTLSTLFPFFSRPSPCPPREKQALCSIANVQVWLSAFNGLPAPETSCGGVNYWSHTWGK